ncbi:MAG TPA: 30S ribosomal protein S7 [Candidatus Gracilibacteria bacterium]
MSEKKVAPAKTAPVKSLAPETKDAKKPAKKETKNVNFQNPFSLNDPLQCKFVNCLMKDGKKTIAQRIMKDMFQELSRRGDPDPLKTFETALKNATPSIEVKAKRIGGAVYQIPIEVKPKRQQSLCIRWILEGARKKKGQPMYKRLASELSDTASEQGYAFGKREDVHKMAQANKAFAHLARY